MAFDRSGSLLGSVELDVAFGLVASSPGGQYLLAYGRTDIDEVVIYRVLGSASEARR